jgi:subtilisin family serine protease
VDATGQGTRCAGIIAAADNRTGITGITAEAELHALG